MFIYVALFIKVSNLRRRFLICSSPRRHQSVMSSVAYALKTGRRSGGRSKAKRNECVAKHRRP